MTDQLPAAAQGPQQTRNALPFDPGNEMLSIVPCNLTVSTQDTPLGQRLCVTVRTVDTTLTVHLAKDEVQSWMDTLAAGKARMSGIILG